MKRTCSECGMVTVISDSHTYDDIWYTWDPGDTFVRLHCPHGSCTLVPESLGTEPLNPARFIMPFGKYKGIAISEIRDSEYLDWLSTNDDLFLRSLISLIE